jgi:hypothetical protein
MKRLFLGLLTAALVAFGAGLHPASASTINVDPSPTDHFNVGNAFPSGGGFDDTYVFTLTHNANLTDSIVVNNIVGFALQVLDPTNTVASFNNLLAGVQYTLHITGTALAGGIYAGQINFSAVTPIPPSVLLFATALVGLGAFGYRRRSTNPAA